MARPKNKKEPITPDILAKIISNTFFTYLFSAENGNADAETMDLLQIEHIDRLIPTLGTRLKFIQGWKAWKKVSHL